MTARVALIALAMSGPALAQDGECSPTPGASLEAGLDASVAAWNALDGDALDESMATVRTQIRCLREPLDLDVVLRVHRAHARHAWTTFDPQLSSRAWLAVRDLSPEWSAEDEADVPPDHPVRTLWNSRQAWTSTLDEQPPGGWVVDGTAKNVVPMDRAFLLQAIDRKGAIAYSAWHATPGDVPQTPWRIARVRRVRHRGTVVAGALAVAGIGALTGAALTREKAKDRGTPDRDLLALKNRATALTAVGVGGVGAGAVTAGLLWGVRW